MWCWRDTQLFEHSENVNRTAMRAVYPNVYTVIKSMLTTSCTTASVECAVYQDGGVINILAKSLRRRAIAIALITLHHNVKVNYSINIGLLTQQTTSWTAWFLKGYFWNTTLDWYFVQIMWPQFFRLSRLSIWEVAYKNIVSVERNPRYLAWRWGKPKLTCNLVGVTSRQNLARNCKMKLSWLETVLSPWSEILQNSSCVCVAVYEILTAV